MKNLKKDLQTVKKDITALIKKVEKLITAVDSAGKPKTVKKAEKAFLPIDVRRPFQCNFSKSYGLPVTAYSKTGVKVFSARRYILEQMPLPVSGCHCMVQQKI